MSWTWNTPRVWFSSWVESESETVFYANWSSLDIQMEADQHHMSLTCGFGHLWYWCGKVKKKMKNSKSLPEKTLDRGCWGEHWRKMFLNEVLWKTEDSRQEEFDVSTLRKCILGRNNTGMFLFMFPWRSRVQINQTVSRVPAQTLHHQQWRALSRTIRPPRTKSFNV